MRIAYFELKGEKFILSRDKSGIRLERKVRFNQGLPCSSLGDKKWITRGGKFNPSKLQ